MVEAGAALRASPSRVDTGLQPRQWAPPLPSWVGRFRPRSAPARGYALSKRMLDLVLVTVTAPLWLITLAAIVAVARLSSGGPVLYRQRRTGRHGERFDMFKIRTMVVGADEHAGADLVPHVDQGPDPKAADDPRVTPVGRLLRRTSLDELPQLWNVLRGEMSLVGPRPTSFPAETYRPWQRERLAVVPGVTGLWQVLARGTTDFDLRAAYDLEYVARRSLRLDLAILLYTAVVVAAGRGAR
jgi:lipopolysaccharide/colanic/teichoic acid biosynthesis glycosyltransferase